MERIITTGKGKFLFVEKPEGSGSVAVWEGTGFRGTKKGQYYISFGIDIKFLPPGQYTFLCTTKDISQTDADKVVDKGITDLWMDYTNTDKDWDSYTNTARGSLWTLMIKNELSIDKNYAILLT